MRKNSLSKTVLAAALASTAVAGVWRLPLARAAEAFAVAREQRVADQWLGAVYVNGQLVMRLRSTPGQGSGSDQAAKVAQRLNELNARGSLSAADMQVRRRGNHALLLSRGNLIASVDPQQAKASGSLPLNLAQSWRNNLSSALRRSQVVGTTPGVTRGQPVSLQVPAEETRTKIVPILSVGSALRVGVAQVSGPVSRVDEVKAVARFDTDYKDAVRIAVLVPIASENVVSNIRRVPAVSVTAVGDLKL